MFFIIKNIFIMKNRTSFRKTVEAGMDPRLSFTFQVDIKPFIDMVRHVFFPIVDFKTQYL